MSLNECENCDHVNPVDARFCNACGKALPSPPLAGDSASNLLFAARAERVTAESDSRASSAPYALAIAFAIPEPGEDALEPVAYSVQFDPDQTVKIGCVYGADALHSAANSDFGPVGADSAPLNHDMRPHDAPGLDRSNASSAEARPHGAAVSESGELSLVLQALRRRPAAVLIGVSAFAALASLSYVSYHQRSAPDLSWPPAVNSTTNGRSEPADDPAPGRRSSGEINEVLPTTANSPIAPTGAVVNADAPQADKLNMQAPIAAVAAPARLGARAVVTNPQNAGRKSTRSPEAATMARTAPETSGNASAPARIGPCTDAVAALGLCAPNSTQRKQ